MVGNDGKDSTNDNDGGNGDDDNKSGSNAQPTKNRRGGRRMRRIVTYMLPFADTLHVRKEHCVVEH